MSDGNSQCKKILRALKKGKRLTALDALVDFRCWRLAPRILELRQDGHAIETEIITLRGKRIARYRLVKKAAA